MFDFLTKAIDNALSIPAAIINGEEVSRQQIAKLISDGVSIAVIAATFGIAEDVVQSMIAGDSHDQ